MVHIYIYIRLKIKPNSVRICLLLNPFASICFDFSFRSVQGFRIVNVFILYKFPCLHIPLIVSVYD